MIRRRSFQATFDEITQQTLDSLNVEQSRNENRAFLDEIGGLETLFVGLGCRPDSGLTTDQADALRVKYGSNAFPESPRKTFLELLYDALSDSTLMVLMGAALVSLIIGIITDPAVGYIEGTAIFVAVFLVANITAFNDYTKELQFRALEQSSQYDERTSVLRNGFVQRINPADLVVGDIVVLQAGDMAPADCIICDNGTVSCNESSLTGEPEDLRKSKDKDCFILSSSLITDGEQCKAIVIGVGVNSQWGKIKSNLVAEPANTPLQEKLEQMTRYIGYIGMGAAVGTFVALVVSIWARHHGKGVLKGFIDAFIMSVTVVVVAIPEGLPLAVTISLAYSTKKMYSDQCFIRVLAACETMGNATNICSDKTGTLTENRMTVVEGWFGNIILDQDNFRGSLLTHEIRIVIAENISVNRTAYVIMKDENGNDLDRPNIIGSKTEGAMLLLAAEWGFDPDQLQAILFDDKKDKLFAFNSAKKRSTCIIHRSDGSVRLFCKGASELLLQDCCLFMDEKAQCQPLTHAKRNELDTFINDMATKALRTLVLAHKDYTHASLLPINWHDAPPDTSGLCLDCIVGIIDPLRADVYDAVATAQAAGVYIRMVTGDNIVTANAIAKQAGILVEGGISIEGPEFRKLTPRQVDEILPKLQVIARSSPDDKYLLVTRLNGNGIPATREEWVEKYRDHGLDISWETDRDKLLPGYWDEWALSRPEGGEVVGVTGDGTNDAPALKAADVGLAMGITGTKVAQSASDIVVLDDKFSSIVRAIMWGRSVYDNIRKFLQFQLTVNIVALILVFIGAVAGFQEPLNAVQMLWVNLVMDTFGALALGTEPPTEALLNRKPYKRSASLISRPMIRNILVQAVFQLTLLLVLLFHGQTLFAVQGTSDCGYYKAKVENAFLWNSQTNQLSNTTTLSATIQQIENMHLLSCESFTEYCVGELDRNDHCFHTTHSYYSASFATTDNTIRFKFSDLEGFEENCLNCVKLDYTLGTIMFNTFIFCQLFNEFNSRSLFNEWNVFKGLRFKHMFTVVILFTTGLQFLLVQFGGEFVKTVPLTGNQWMITILLGALGLPIGFLSRLIPVVEDPNSFYDKTCDPIANLNKLKEEKQQHKLGVNREVQFRTRNKTSIKKSDSNHNNNNNHSNRVVSDNANNNSHV